jgi:ABC-type branched-subunit amino acid transport system substrate-binding protein
MEASCAANHPRLNDGVLHGPEGGGRARRDTDLIVDVLDVVIGGLRGDEELIADLLRGESARGQAQNIDFAAGKSRGIIVTANGGTIEGEEYFPLDHADYSKTVEKIMSSGTDVVFNTIVPPGLIPFLEQLHNAGFTKRGGKLVCTYFEEILPPAQVEGVYGCLDYYQTVTDPFSVELLHQYNKLFPGSSLFTAGSAATGTYRGLKFWEAAVKEAGTLDQDAVVKALDHAKIAAGPGGPAEMVPGQHHARLNMYIAQASHGIFNVVKNLGVIEPKESVISASQAAAR